MNMSFLSNLLAAQNADRAVADARNTIAAGQDRSLSALGQGYNTARGDVTSATGQAVNAINQGGATAQGFYDQGLNRSLSALTGGFDRAFGAMDRGYGDATAAVNRGIDVNQPFYNTGVSANTMYSNALGLGGAGGNEAAVAAYKASPGYQNAVNSAVDTISRKASALGGVGGNALSAIGDSVGGLALNDYGNWLNRLSGVSAAGQNAAGNMQSGYNTLGNAATNYGNNSATLATNLGTGTSNLYGSYGTNSANLANTNAANTASIYGNQGTALGNLATGYGQNQANIYTGAANNIADAGLKGAQLVNEAFTSGAASMDAQNNAAANRRMSLVGGLLGALGGVGAGFAMGRAPIPAAAPRN
jgi:hypothetical protein